MSSRAPRAPHAAAAAERPPDPDRRRRSGALLSASTYLGVTLFVPLTALLHGRFGYWAVGVEAAAGCLLAAVVLARIPPDTAVDQR